MGEMIFMLNIGQLVDTKDIYTCISNTYNKALLINAKLFGIEFMDNLVVIENNKLIEHFGLKESFGSKIVDYVKRGRMSTNVFATTYVDERWEDAFIMVRDLEKFMLDADLALGILTHEAGHIKNRTRDEFKADEYAVKLGCGKQLLSVLDKDVRALTEALLNPPVAVEQLESRITRLKRSIMS
jgi:hypothetical protein